ncbi:hypothetical protein LXL04_016422 [Taraxacum kok-saghyz]
MPISTVASESAFSTGGRVIDKYRSSLNPETAEALICAQDWIRCTRVDLELGSSMKNKDIDEFNEKFEGIKIGNKSPKFRPSKITLLSSSSNDSNVNQNPFSDFNNGWVDSLRSFILWNFVLNYVQDSWAIDMEDLRDQFRIQGFNQL